MYDKELVEKDIFSKVLRAGRRTYFFDVRATKADDYYITITESKKFTEEDGSYHGAIGWYAYGVSWAGDVGDDDVYFERDFCAVFDGSSGEEREHAAILVAS